LVADNLTKKNKKPGSLVQSDKTADLIKQLRRINRSITWKKKD